MKTTTSNQNINGVSAETHATQSRDVVANNSIQILAATLSGKHEAPLVVGHLKHDNPAFGWAESKQLDSG